jgi:hypothetical protein
LSLRVSQAFARVRDGLFKICRQVLKVLDGVLD